MSHTSDQTCMVDDIPPKQTEDLTTLLAAIRGGDREAIDTVVRQYYDQVERVVHRRLQQRFRSNGSWVSAMFSTGDIVHTVFLKVLTGQIHLVEANEAQFVAYLIKAVESQIVDTTRFHSAARRDRRRHHSPTESGERLAEVETAHASPLELAWGNEQRAIYAEVIEGFPTRDRELLKLRIEQRHSFEYLANRLGYNTIDAARKAFHSAKARLLVRLGARGVDVGKGVGE